MGGGGGGGGGTELGFDSLLLERAVPVPLYAILGVLDLEVGIDCGEREAYERLESPGVPVIWPIPLL